MKCPRDSEARKRKQKREKNRIIVQVVCVRDPRGHGG